MVLNTGVAKGVPFDTPSTDLEGEHRGVTEMEGGLGPESSSAYQRSNKTSKMLTSNVFLEFILGF